MTRTYFQTFNRLDKAETDITVEYLSSGGHPGSWDEPPEGSEIEIIDAWIDDGTQECITVKLTDAEVEKFTNWLVENHEDDDEPDYDYHRDDDR